MATQVIADLIQEYTSTTGTGALTLSGAVPGFARFVNSSKVTNGCLVPYTIKNQANWEIGIGTWGTGSILTRTTILATFVAGTLNDSAPTAITLVGQSVVTLSGNAKNLSDLYNAPHLDNTITTAGTTGAQTINKPAGAVNFAAAAASLVVTNSLVTANSIIIASIGTNDATMKEVLVVAGAGSFTLYAGAVPTAETRVNFAIVSV